MKIDRNVLNGKYSLKTFSFSQELCSNREVLAQAKIIQRGDQEYILRGLSLYNNATSIVNEVTH